MPTDRLGLVIRTELRDQRFSFGDGRSDGGQLKRSRVTFLAVPHLSDPNPIHIFWIFGDDVAQAPGHTGYTIEQDLDKFVAFSFARYQTADQTVHLRTSRHRFRRRKKSVRARTNRSCDEFATPYFHMDRGHSVRQFYLAA